MHGVGGSGKTTLCKAMANFYKSVHCLESAIMQFSLYENKDTIINECKKVLKRLNLANRKRVEVLDCFDQAMQVMEERMKSQAVFLALDNVWEHCREEAKRILEVSFGPGSKVLVTSRSEELLKDLLTHKAYVRPLISLNKDEALETFRASFEGDLLFVSRRSLGRALSLCRFSGSYHPLALKALGRNLKYMGGAGDSNAFEGNLARISSDLQGYEIVGKLIKMNYDSTSRVGKKMFLDVAVVFRRTRSFKMLDEDIAFEEMREWLGSLYEHECAHDKIDNQLHRLALDGLVQFEGEGKQRTVTVHDLYVSLAEREVACSSRFLLGGRGIMEAVQWAELERVVLDVRCEETVKLQVGPKLQLLYLRGQTFSKGLQLKGARALRLLKVVDCIGKLKGLNSVLKLEALHLKVGSSSDDIKRLLRDVRSCAPLKSLVLAGEGFCGAGKEDAAAFLCGLTNLVSIQLCYWRSLRELPDSTLVACGSPCRLEVIHLLKCASLQRIADLGRFLQLHELVLRECEALEEIAGMAVLSNLEVLRLYGCSSLRRIPDVDGCASLRELDLRECGSVEEMVGKALPSNLEVLRLYGCRSLQRIPDVGSCASLRELDLREFGAVEEVVGKALPSNLEVLRLYSCKSLQRIQDLGGCASLRELVVRGCGALEEMAGNALPSNLKVLRFCDCRSLQRIPDVSGCASLRELVLFGCGSLKEIAGMALSYNLEVLRVYGCRSLQRIPYVGGCVSLREMVLFGCGAMDEVPSPTARPTSILSYLHGLGTSSMAEVPSPAPRPDWILSYLQGCCGRV